MSLELILPFLRHIEPLFMEENISVWDAERSARCLH